MKYELEKKCKVSMYSKDCMAMHAVIIRGGSLCKGQMMCKCGKASRQHATQHSTASLLVLTG